MIQNLLISLMPLILVSCSHTIYSGASDRYEQRSEALPWKGRPVEIEFRARESDDSERARTAMTYDIYLANDILASTGYSFYRVEYETKMNFNNRCPSCALGGYIWPEIITATIVVRWYGVTLEGTQIPIAEKTSKIREITSLFFIPYGVPLAIYRGFSKKYEGASLLHKINGREETINVVIDLNLQIVKAVQTGEIKIPPASKPSAERTGIAN